ncbi:hypothetical protein FK004_08025 [Flavobacterium kingsejongi]|uniref:Uncharacterized protein n=1 Tax=Flavobacterium kingsejongi TaxID=1678728 RepID=A0A2S1LN61_9FLAO|nr:hypothetical protein FK004_08025 [Flavobacterium kingsejongi]
MSERSRYRNIREQKSPKERFLLVIGIVFFLLYFVLGMFVIFWKDFPMDMPQGYRIMFGVLLIVYAFFRFIRLLQKN